METRTENSYVHGHLGLKSFKACYRGRPVLVFVVQLNTVSGHPQDQKKVSA